VFRTTICVEFLLRGQRRQHRRTERNSASNRNEYQEYFLRGKCGRCLGLTTFKCRLSRNLGASTSWSPKGLSRPVMGLLYLFFSTFTECLGRCRPIPMNCNRNVSSLSANGFTSRVKAFASVKIKVILIWWSNEYNYTFFMGPVTLMVFWSKSLQ
jgi:hypothetical protein